MLALSSAAPICPGVCIPDSLCFISLICLSPRKGIYLFGDNPCLLKKNASRCIRAFQEQLDNVSPFNPGTQLFLAVDIPVVASVPCHVSLKLQNPVQAP